VFKHIRNFFGKLDFKQKIALLIISVIIPFLIPSYFSYKQYIQELNIIHNEEQAVKLNNLINKLILLIQQHRCLMEQYLNGNKQIENKIKEKEKKIKEYFKLLKKSLKPYDKNTNLTILENLYDKLTIQHINKNTNSFLLHTRIIKELIETEKNIANTLGLFQDKNINNHFLMVSTFYILPNIIETSAQLRGYLSGILLKDKITEKEKENIQNLAISLKNELNELKMPVFKYASINKNAVYLQKKYNELNNLINNYLSYIKQILRQEKKISSKDFFIYSTKIINEIYQYHDSLINEFKKNLELRKDNVYKNMIMLISGLLVLFLFILYMFTGFYYSINDPLKEIEKAIEEIKKGNLSVSLKIDTNDEMKKLGDILNKMAYKLKEQITILKAYKTVLDYSNLIIICNTQGNISYINEKFSQLTGYKEEVIKKSFLTCKYLITPQDILQNIWKTVLNKEVWSGYLKIKSKSGNIIHTKTVFVPILDQTQNIQEIIIGSVDITELIHAQEKIKKMLYYDNLTSLPKRIKLVEDLKQKKFKSNNIIILNIDDFRQINDIYGYEGGNFVLKECAHILKETVGKTGKVYKFPSDEFAVVINQNLSKKEIINYAQKIIQILENHVFHYNNLDIKIFVKAGVALIVNNYEKIENILLDADSAIKEAKRKDLKVIYYKESEKAKNEYVNKIHWVEKIKKAIEEDRIVPFFQPIYNNKTKKIEKYESLVRLIDEEGKVISPYFFLDIAKKSKLYIEITKIMIRKTFEVFKDRPESVSINLSTLDIEDDNVSQYILDQIQKYSMQKKVIFEESETEHVVIEITETEEVENYDLVGDFIKKAHKVGAEAAIDDFGSGYSNFVYILNMGIKYLKIDGSLIKNLLTDEKSKTLVKAIIDFAQELGIKTIAEFVENKEIENELIKIGVDYSQGYYFSEPIPKEKLPV